MPGPLLPPHPRSPLSCAPILPVALGVALAFTPGSADAQNADEVQSVVRATVTPENGYRLDFPGEAPETPDLAQNGRRERPRWDGPSGEALATGATLADMLLWLGGIVAAGLVVSFLARRWLGAAPPPDAPAPHRSETADETLGGVRDLDPELHVLVAAGDFSAAIHLLLRRALRRVAGGDPPPALTARAALRTLPLTAERRAALGVLVDAVERTRYAGVAPDAALYARCAAASEAL